MLNITVFKVGDEVIVLEKDSNSKTFARWKTGTVVNVLSPHSYIVSMPNGSRRHLHATRMRKLVVNTYNVGAINDHDTEFGDVDVAPTDAEASELTRKVIDQSSPP